MFATMGYGVYFFFAALSLGAFVFTFFLIPETKGVPLEMMDRLFKIKPVWRAHKELMSQLHVDEEQFRANIKGSGFTNQKTEQEQQEHVENGGNAGETLMMN